MFARVHRLRRMGVLIDARSPPAERWPSGILDFGTEPTDLVNSRASRLILQTAMAAPGKGVICELFEPRLIRVWGTHEPPGLVFRGIEPVKLQNGQVGAVLQEWLVAFIR
jgi:hypothetical protein